MLEGYLNQTTKAIPDLQQEANRLAKEIINQVQATDTSSTSTLETTTDMTKGDLQAPRSGNTDLPSRPRH